MPQLGYLLLGTDKVCRQISKHIFVTSGPAIVDIFMFTKQLFLFQVTPGGKADLSQAIAVGDEIVAVNGIECQSRAEAIELVRCSRQKLNIALKR